MSIGVNDLWWSNDEEKWNTALKDYWESINDKNIRLEKKIENINVKEVKEMKYDEFYDFLYDEYFVWKYTAANRLATTRKNLEKYNDDCNKMELKEIHEELFNFDLNDVKRGIEIVTKIHGLGIAGASGLLSILFPESFATVDQFVVKALLKINGLEENSIIKEMKPEGLRLKDAELLIKIMKDKAEELNDKFNTSEWTPRKIDKVLWSIDR